MSLADEPRPHHSWSADELVGAGERYLRGLPVDYARSQLAPGAASLAGSGKIWRSSGCVTTIASGVKDVSIAAGTPAALARSQPKSRQKSRVSS